MTTILDNDRGHKLLGSDDADFIRAEGGDDTVLAGAGDDILRGGDGDDALFAGAGDDYLYGGNGADVLTGGNGADRFYFGALGEGLGDKDIIADFSAGDDIRIDPKGDAGLYRELDAGELFIGGKGGADEDALVSYNPKNGNVFYVAGGHADRVCTLADLPADVSARDFLIPL